MTEALMYTQEDVEVAMMALISIFDDVDEGKHIINGAPRWERHVVLRIIREWIEHPATALKIVKLLSDLEFIENKKTRYMEDGYPYEVRCIEIDRTKVAEYVRSKGYDVGDPDPEEVFMRMPKVPNEFCPFCGRLGYMKRKRCYWCSAKLRN